MEQLAEIGFRPEQLGLKLDKPEDISVINRFAEISRIFQALRTPFFAMSPERVKELLPTQEGHHVEEPPSYPPDFKIGIDYQFGKNRGNPSTIEENARDAIYHGRPGVPIWAILKSVAVTIPGTDQLVIVHLRGDRKVDDTKLSRRFGVVDKLPMASEEQLNNLGFERGVVNPLIPDDPRITHIFDRDLFSGEDYPESDLVFTSSGDHRFYVAFNVRKYLQAKYQNHALRIPGVSDVSEPGPKRIIARRPVFIVCGDSLDDGVRFTQIIGRDITNLLIKHGQYFGDQSHTHVRLISDPELAGSIDTNLYGAALQDHIRSKVIPAILRESKDISAATPLAVYGSFANEGIGGDDLLGKVKGIEYIGSKSVVENLLATLRREHVRTAYTLLLGLSSAYVADSSAFAGKILEGAQKASKGFVDSRIQPFVTDLKQRNMSDAKKKFYQIIESMLRSAEQTRISSPNLDALAGKTVIAILGVSEFENLVSDDWDNIDEPPPDQTPGKGPKKPEFLIIRSNDPTVIKKELEQAKADKNQRQKIRVVCISPKRADSETIAQKTLGLIA